MLIFAAAVFFLVLTPGPGVLTTAGVGAGYGYRTGLTYVTGLCIGHNLVSLAVVSGVAAVVLSWPIVRVVLMVASFAYLVWLASRIAFAGSQVAFIAAQRAPGFVDGLALQAINPKAYAVNTALFAGFAFMPENMLAQTAIKFALLNAIWIPLHFVWLWAGVSLKRLDLSERTQRRINYAMAASLLVVVALALMA